MNFCKTSAHTSVETSHLLKAMSTYSWTDIDKLTIEWKSDLAEKNKTGILPSSSHVTTIVWLHCPDFKETLEEKAI